MISLHPLRTDLLDEALDIQPVPTQLEFVETTGKIIHNRNASEDVHLIMSDTKVVGLFKIDRGYSSIMPFCKKDELGLRGFVIDAQMQGQGIGTQASLMLGQYLADAYPEKIAVLLTVNCKNAAAQRAYLKGGFIDMGELYLGGSAGPQHIYRKSLSAH